MFRAQPLQAPLHTDGFSGELSLIAPGSLDADEAVMTLERLGALISWAQAQQALVVGRIENLMASLLDAAPAAPVANRTVKAFDLTAAEVGAALRIPHVTAQRVVAESETLMHQVPATLARLGTGQITYSHARVILDEIRCVPAEDTRVLEAVQDRTAAQLARKARLMRERRYPDSVPERHRDALSKRRVMLDAAPDGMACLTAVMAAEKAQALFNRLTAAARTQRNHGDSRTQDQLRVDLLAAAVLGRRDAGPNPAAGPRCAGMPDEAVVHDEAGVAEEELPGMRTELMVIINAETLLGVDEQPAELNGYGAISADAARRLIRSGTHWTGLACDPETGTILSVGRRRKIPSGLTRWLQARDGTCRFPGCSVNVLRAGVEIDHTVPWAHGGPSDHGNLEHLCAKHHRLKPQGFWKAKQQRPGELEWLSPLARRYGTEPQLVIKPRSDRWNRPPGAESPEERWAAVTASSARTSGGRQEPAEARERDGLPEPPPPF